MNNKTHNYEIFMGQHVNYYNYAKQAKPFFHLLTPSFPFNSKLDK